MTIGWLRLGLEDDSEMFISIEFDGAVVESVGSIFAVWLELSGEGTFGCRIGSLEGGKGEVEMHCCEGSFD